MPAKTTSLQLDRPLAIFDIEATGTNTQTDRIVEIAIVRLHPDGRQDPHVFRLNPEMPIPPEVSRIHGIRDEDVRDCPTFTQSAPAIAAALEHCDLAGFNLLRFDIPMLAQEFHRAGLAVDLVDRRVIDVQRIFHKREPRDLTAALSFYCNELHLDAHGAMPDVAATLRVLEGQLQRYRDLPHDVAALDAYCNPRDPAWLDRDGRLKWEGDEVVVNFGKKKGTRLRDLVRDDPGFVKWLLRSDFPREVKTVFEQAQRGEWPTPPAPEGA